MSKSKRANRYSPEFRRQMIDRVRDGGRIAELAQEFGCTAWTISRWIRQTDQEASAGEGGRITGDRIELLRLRRENRQLRTQRAILAKAAAWFAQGIGVHSKRLP